MLDKKILLGVIAIAAIIVGGVIYSIKTQNESNIITNFSGDASSTETFDSSVSKTSTSTVTNNYVKISTVNENNNTPKVVNDAVLHTNYGDIEFAFATTAPKTAQNFITLAVTKFYDGVRFHRVIKGFMIQGGDPLSKDVDQKARWGTGGPGYTFADELSGNEKYEQGTVAMANSGPNTNGSQFFIVTASPGAPLPPSYTVFGHVVKGMDVALKIENVKTDSSDRPLTDVIIKSVDLK